MISCWRPPSPPLPQPPPSPRLRWSLVVAMFPTPLLAALVLLAILQNLANGETSTLESVPDLEKAMYLNIQGYPCVRLLNLSGEIGCSNPGRGKVIAPLRRLANADDQLTHLSAVLVSLDEMNNFLLRCSSDPKFAQNVAGVLVESTISPKMALGFSPDNKFPQAKFAPYQNHSYAWNPTGTSIMWNHYNFPVFLLSGEGTSIVQERADKNVKRNGEYPVDVAEFDLIMQTTAVGSHESESCLKDKSCIPLGGYSVWTSLPPIAVSSMKQPKPILLVLASQDSASFFRDRSLGADSPLSGLIALLVAVDALTHVDGLEELKKQLVFAVFTGEAWGYLGSRRFLSEIDTGSDSVNGLNSTMIQQILEIGSVGKGLTQSSTTFFAHSQGDPSSTKDILSALHSASDSLGSDNVIIKTAGASNPGIPPSSLMSFLGKNSSSSGILLEEFDASFTNKLYHSHLDSSSNVNSSSIAAAAALVARALYILASDDSPLNLISLNSIRVNMSLVEELVGCLLTCEPGLSCGIVKNFISPLNACPSHYVGVFLDSSPDTQYPQFASDTSRFVWNFLADRTSDPKGNTSSCTGQCSNEDQVCIGFETERGKCVTSTTRYVPAYSTRLKIKDNSWRILSANASDPLGSVDPVWTESNWKEINLRVYTIESSTYDLFVLLGGVAITVAAYIAAVAIKVYLSKALKRD